MLDDEIEPRARPAEARPLDPLSVDELEAYIVSLKAEIARVEAAIAAKRVHRDAVAALFKTPG
jgi:uncharacterized small protein (DUF1192 family)